MLFESEIKQEVVKTIKHVFNVDIAAEVLTLQQTKKEFEGDITLVVFGLTKQLQRKPQEIGDLIGAHLLANCEIISGSNLIQGFLNLTIDSKYWKNCLEKQLSEALTVNPSSSDRPVLVEYSSPNTNKPLHLGHIRNNLLGFSISEILAAVGNNVVKTNIVNDRGIHICKSMIAWKKFGNNETPQSSKIKGDHLVGKYYVKFDQELKTEISDIVAQGVSEDEAKKSAPLMMETQSMLRDWEDGKPEVMELWRKMNGWVYDGFDITYKRLGVDFDKIYYESDTYLIGKTMVEEGLKNNVLFKKEDGSVWIDLQEEGLDQKLLLRKDGTAVYMTQDLGTAWLRYRDFNFSSMMYVVGNEQDYHFKVLKIVLKKLGYAWADTLQHLSYNMVDLPGGKMKSREGTVVDADDLMQEMVAKAEEITSALGKIEGFTAPEQKELYENIGLGALKYYMLKVDPEKRMLFNPEESIDFNGNTGPFIQYTYARIRSVLRKTESDETLKEWQKNVDFGSITMHDREKELLKQLVHFKINLEESAGKFSPAHMANYCYDVSKLFNQFYHDCPILDPENSNVSAFRLALAHETGRIVDTSMRLLGIQVPERM